MAHYICTGTCKGVSDVSKKCEDKSCTLFDHELAECDCVDGRHYGRHYGRQDAHIEENKGE